MNWGKRRQKIQKLRTSKLKTYLVMQNVDSIVTSMLGLIVCRELHTWPYRLHQAMPEYRDAYQPIWMPNRCYSKHQLCSIYRNHWKKNFKEKCHLISLANIGDHFDLVSYESFTLLALSNWIELAVRAKKYNYYSTCAPILNDYYYRRTHTIHDHRPLVT